MEGNHPAKVWLARHPGWCAGLLAVLLAGAWPCRAGSDAWKTLEGAVLVSNPANDGDSFHVRHGRKRYLVRLYFVDAPETDLRFPDRVRAQAKAFGTREELILQHGAAAAEFVREHLKTPFTVLTRFEDARGASQRERIYAMVKVDGRYLDERLVEEGLARIYGLRRTLPDGASIRLHLKRLRALEKDAQWRKAGLWSGRASALAMPVAADDGDGKADVYRLTTDAAFYTADSMPTFRGYLKAGDAVRILSVTGEWGRVRAPFRGQLEIGHCRRRDLGR